MYKYLFIALFFASALQGCKEENENKPFDAGDRAPAPVTNVQVENIPGGARITYDRPKDESLLYVKAEYEIRPGVDKEAKASYYLHTLTVDGFPDTSDYEVKLYSVSRGENTSDPVTVKIKPLTPPVAEVFQSITIRETYGGVRVNFVNLAESDVVLTLLATDSLGDLVQADAYYTKVKQGTFAARGFSPEKRRFGVFVRDRWNNHSDTLFAELTPKFEEQLDKSKFKEVDLPGDTYKPHVGSGMHELWDNSWNSSSVFHTMPGSGLPQWFTFDMGVSVKLSRFKFYHRLGAGQGATDGAYTGADPRVFEIWGSNDPNPNGDWDSTWIKLGDFQSIKPSGQPEGVVTNEDFQFSVVNGEDFDFPEGIPSVRYLRWKTDKVWGALDHCYIAELTFWGNDQ